MARRALFVLLLFAFTLGGCSSLRSLVGAPPKVDPADAAASAAAAGPLIYSVVVQAPDGLDKLLEQHLDLGRYQRTGDQGGITRGELDRLIAATPAQARSLLETEGYFNADVKAERDRAATPKVTVTVVPGPRARISEVTIVEQGALLEAEQAGDERAKGIVARLKNDWPLKAGQVFTQGAWSSAKNQAIVALSADGYPRATWSGTSAKVDPETNTVQIYVVADSGPLFRLGELRIRGISRYDESIVRNLSTYTPGDIYTEKRLADFQERLQKAGFFESSSVLLDTDAADPNAAAVSVRVRESPPQQATVGVGISANTGPRLSLEHLHRKVFGYEVTAKNKFEIGRDLKSWEGQLTSYPKEDQYRNLLAGGYYKLDAADEILNSWKVRAGRSQETDRIDRLYYVELLSDSTQTDAGSDYGRAATLNYNWIWRDLDSVLLPTKGLTLSLESAGGYAFATSNENGPLARLKARTVAYVPLGHDWNSQFRLEAGQVFARPTVGVPDTLLYRAGGDDSVRGYGYRTLGPIVNGVVVSARTLFTASAEVAHPISDKLPNVWWATFIDAGQAADRWQDMRLALGYGVGLRLRSPVGPLRVDLAYGQDVHRVRLHLSVGIAL